jgi:hypothetical protein
VERKTGFRRKVLKENKPGPLAFSDIRNHDVTLGKKIGRILRALKK